MEVTARQERREEWKILSLLPNRFVSPLVSLLLLLRISTPFALMFPLSLLPFFSSKSSSIELVRITEVLV